jgi:hypothetical protein
LSELDRSPADSCVFFISFGAKQAADQGKIPGQRPVIVVVEVAGIEQAEARNQKTTSATFMYPEQGKHGTHHSPELTVNDHNLVFVSCSCVFFVSRRAFGRASFSASRDRSDDSEVSQEDFPSPTLGDAVYVAKGTPTGLGPACATTAT